MPTQVTYRVYKRSILDNTINETSETEITLDISGGHVNDLFEQILKSVKNELNADE